METTTEHDRICRILAKETLEDLQTNILPFWLKMIDRNNGGFYGQIDFNGTLNREASKGGIYISRILWTFARAYRLLGNPDYLAAAQAACDFLTTKLWDDSFGGIFWSVDTQGNPLDTKKMFYVQAFAIYGLSELHRATGSDKPLAKARELYDLIETHAYDPKHKGYFEGASRDWKTVEPMILGEDEEPTHKSMNTHLHIQEAYSNLLLAWDDTGLRAKQRELVQVMCEKIVDPQTHHFKLYFDAQWTASNEHISYGHDIEGSWLLEEAATILGDSDLIDQVTPIALKMGTTIYNEGIDEADIVQWEGDATGVVDTKKYWWALAEQVVGFFNLYQMTGEKQYLDVTCNAWAYIREQLIDREGGEWIWGRFEDGSPIPKDKAGIWKGPYHNGRMALELFERVKR
ncbi:Cellobiose 2-epimerase [Pontiella desulfatans]|uniref:Cellobiose 2-epimerase n=1 Tax=Pontiella desulfatans TaxID=2750659 RepID=A0A6C2U352_PONDE|nr:AGE family epimerase/isomerase [Pontiella desulfatans]VGO13991.1 Cellobiose 2-epimerase [Pontiella desulfatans]